MPQSDGKNRLKRMEIDFDGETYKFNVNPEEYTQEETSRSTVTQTKGGAWIDDFGAGLPTIFIKGSTGFERGLGVEKFKELRSKIRKYYDSGTLGSTPKTEMIFHNFTDDESWVVHTDPSGIRLLRNKNNPLLYVYELKFICLRPATHPASRTRTGGVNKSIGVNTALTSKTASNLDVAVNKMMSTLSMLKKSAPNNLAGFVKDLEVIGMSIKNLNKQIKSMGLMSLMSSSVKSPSLIQIESSYENQLSRLAIDELNKLKSGESVITYDRTNPPILEEITKLKLPSELLIRLKGIFLELVAIVKNYEEENFRRKMSDVDVYRLIKNIEYVCEKLFEHSHKTYKVIEDLRLLQRVLYYLLDTELFEETIKDKIESMHAE